MAEHSPYRLPDDTVPKHYQLEIEPDLARSRFNGHVAIDVEVRETAAQTIINAVGLTLSRAVLKAPDGHERAARIEYNHEEEQVVLNWAEPAKPGRWVLDITYEGILGHDMRGFYRTQVTDKGGQEALIASTQCEQTDARRVFPGWDEPEFKASFAVTLVVDPDQAAFSNSREISRVPDGRGKHRVVFARTIPMSTYLVALVVGPYETTQPVMVGEVPVRIAARPGFSHLTAFAEKAAVDTLIFFERYFGIPYPGDKLDHIAIPEFAAGAMENLGLVTYREELLLLDPDKSSPIEQGNVVEVIAHETAHMWFGDLVTMRWWNGIWLNEAFATFMALLATDSLHPEWDPWTIFSHGRSMAMVVDSLQSTRPIEFPVNRPVDAWAMFDLLTYQKGGSVLRMLEQYLGAEIFRKSIVHYLQKHRYANTDTGDLWDAIERTSHQPIRLVMESWVLQPGFPLVQVHFDAEAGQVTITQKRFSYANSAEGLWQVPLTIAISRQDGTETVVREILGPDPVVLTVPSNMAWLHVNRGGWGFFRTAYDEDLSARLSRKAMAHLSAVERYQLLDDVWAAVEADDVPLSRAVQMWRGMIDEKDPDVWGAVTPHLEILDVMADDVERAAIASLVRDMARPLFRRLTWDSSPNEDARTGRVRGVLLHLLGTLGQETTVHAEAKRRWLDHVNGRVSLAPEILTPVVNVVAQGGDASVWNRMYQEYKQASTPQDERRYLFALARFTAPDLVQRTLELYLSSEVRQQDGTIALGRLLSNRHATAVTWTALESHWENLRERYPERVFEGFLTVVANIVDDRLADRIGAWLEQHPIEAIARPVAQALEFQGVNRRLAHRLSGRLGGLLV